MFRDDGWDRNRRRWRLVGVVAALAVINAVVYLVGTRDDDRQVVSAEEVAVQGAVTIRDDEPELLEDPSSTTADTQAPPTTIRPTTSTETTTTTVASTAASAAAAPQTDAPRTTVRPRRTTTTARRTTTTARPTTTVRPTTTARPTVPDITLDDPIWKPGDTTATTSRPQPTTSSTQPATTAASTEDD